MEKLTIMLGFFVTLSLATERITEVFKGLPILSVWFAVEKTDNPTKEAFRKATVQVLAIAVGAIFAHLVPEAVASALNVKADSVDWWICLLVGALASGGSGFWNSLLDASREIKKQKETITKQMVAALPR